MADLGNVIELGPRLRRARRALSAAGQGELGTRATRSTHAARRRAVCFSVAFVLLLVALMAIDRFAHGPRAIVPAAATSAGADPEIATRQAFFDRARADVETACQAPKPNGGLLQRHCTDQARFLLALPECAGACRQLALAALPRGR